MTEPRRACPACGSPGSRLLPQYSRDEWEVHACEACGFVYLKNPPAYERLIDEFAWEKTSAAEYKRRHTGRPVYRALDRATSFRWKFRRNTGRRYLKAFSAGRVLDVGCGPGTILPEPLVPYGIELSAALHAEADANMRARGGYALFGPGIEKMAEFPDAFFDGVLMSSILEHEKDPKALLAGVWRVLKPAGRLYLKLPNYNSSNRRLLGARWSGFRYPDHVNYFTVPHLRRMATEAGFRFEQLDRWRPFSDNMHALLTKPA